MVCLYCIPVYIGCGPLTVTVTTRIITFLAGDSYKPSFATVTGRGPYPMYTSIHLYHKISRKCWLFIPVPRDPKRVFNRRMGSSLADSCWKIARAENEDMEIYDSNEFSRSSDNIVLTENYKSYKYYATSPYEWLHVMDDDSTRNRQFVSVFCCLVIYIYDVH